MTTIVRRSQPIKWTPRAKQVAGLFDIEEKVESVSEWNVSLTLPDEWSIGVIVGPSGAGKSTIARQVFGVLDGVYDWSADTSVIDGFPKSLSIRDVVGLLTAVGFSSPPSWLRSYANLSTGEQFRVALARAISEDKEIIVVDEFTSVVDRRAAQVAAHAVQKAIRRMGKQFVAVTCHYDVLEWLEPDWIYEPHLDRLTVGRSLHRPKIELAIYPTGKETWAVFRKHHYLDTRLHTAAKCFVLLWDDVPVGFCAAIPFPRGRNSFANKQRAYREHRVVILPDYQGIGLGRVLSEFVGSLFTAVNVAYYSRTSHPGFIASRNHHPDIWRLSVYGFSSTKALTMREKAKTTGDIIKAPRKTATHQYIGPPYVDRDTAAKMLVYAG